MPTRTRIENMNEEALIAALDRLGKKVDQMTTALGRGAPNGGSKGGTGGKKAESPVEKALENNLKEQIKMGKETIKSRKKETDAIKDNTDALEDTTDAQEDLSKATKDLEKDMYGAAKGVGKFGKDLLFGTGSVGNALESLSSRMSWSGGTFGKIIGGMAAGAGFMLGQMESFAKDASSLGGYADLGAFKVGSIRQAKLMSGLGDAFIKSLTQSQGGFKVFGATTQDAVENVSNLSRGFMTGSKYLNRAMRDNLGPELTKTVDEASRAVAAMGLSQEDAAGVTGMLMSTIQFTAKSEKEAQQMLAKQFKETVVSARSLSEAFGTSAQEVIKTMQEFQNSASGNLARLEGNKAAMDVYQIIKEMGIAKSPAEAQRLALAMTEGKQGLATSLTKDNTTAQALSRMLYDSVQAAGGESATGDKTLKELSKQTNSIESLYNSFGGKNSPLRYLGGELGDMADVTASALAMTKRYNTSQTQNGANAGKGAGAGTTEADNIKSMTTLSANLDSLRSSVNFLTAAIVGLTGAIGAVLVGGAVGGLLGGGKGFMGKLAEGISGMFGGKGKTSGPGATKIPGVPGVPGASGGMNTFGKWLEGLGSSGAMKGAATITILGGALVLLATGLKTFNEVDWSSVVKGGLALGGLILAANLLSGASASIIMGAGAVAILGAAVTLSAYGFKVFNEVNWESLAKAAVAITAFSFGMDLLVPLVPGMLIGSLGLIALGASMFVFAKGIEQFNSVKWEDLAKGTAALVAFGLASVILIPALIPLALAAVPLIAFGAGLAVFAKGVEQFNKVEWDSVGKGAASLVALGLASVLLLPALIPMALAAIPLIAFGAGLAVFAKGVESFNKVEWGSLAKGSLALVAFGAASILLLPALIPLVAVAIPLIAFGAALAIFANGVESFNKVEWDSLDKGAASLLAFGLTSIFLIPALLPLAVAAVPLLAFGAALAIFAMGVKQFNDVEWSSIGKGALAIGVLALTVTGLALLAPGIIAGSIALGFMAVAIGILGVAMIPAAYAVQIFADSMKTLGEISGDNLVRIGEGLASIGLGMVVFAAGMLAGTASSVITGIMSLFGAKSPLDKIMEYVPYADAISKIGEGIMRFGEGVIKINQGLGDLDIDALSRFKEKLIDFAKAGSTNEVKLTADYLQKIGNSLEKINNLGDITLPNMQDLTTPGVGALDLGGTTNNYSLFGNAGGSNSAVTPEVISQVIAYLSTMQNDLDAIRGNTRTAAMDSPVRLS